MPVRRELSQYSVLLIVIFSLECYLEVFSEARECCYIQDG